VSHLLLLFIVGAFADAGEVDEHFFRRQIAPILERSCVGCHHGVAARGGLSLETAAALAKGGDTGPVVIKGDASASRLIEVVSGDTPEMPAEGEPLRREEVSLLRRWIAGGAPWPDELVLQDKRGGLPWWSLRPLSKPDVPAISDEQARRWIRNTIDAFVLARLREQGLAPSPEADRGTLIRRLTFDLHGLPPTPEEVQAFMADTDPRAYESLVDRLLASPRYGERWARHWLDVVHFGETHGYDKDKRRDHAWPYRDYVIRAFNDDKPYGEFVREQLAGDVLKPGEPDGVIATGFIAAGPWDFVGHVELREGTVEKAKTRSLDRDDMVANVMSTFTSMTVHCARCHDHAFDPIPQTDYYRLQAVFAGVDRKDVSYAQAAADSEQEKGPALVYAIEPHEPREIRILQRGDVEKPGELAEPGALSCLPGLPGRFVLADPNNEGTRRAALAAWIADPANCLTWRSIVNRAWHYHFGRGIVDTPSDFGRNGGQPTHPELLDWLAVEFRDGGQSLKALHRLIVTSAAYRQSVRHDQRSAALDAGNRYLWRMNRRRLEAEEIRDAMLAASGKLDLSLGGPSFELFEFKDDHSPRYDYVPFDKPEVWRRSVYRFLTRSVPNPWMEALDCPDASLSTPVRSTTITALQALAVLNDDFIVRQAQHMARRIESELPDANARIDRACWLCLSRSATDPERETLAAYAAKYGLAAACRLLFNTNEFVFVE
jgi:hypothetical protein